MAGGQLGYTPAWALGSVGAISFFPILDSVKTLKILPRPARPAQKRSRSAAAVGTELTVAFGLFGPVSAPISTIN